MMGSVKWNGLFAPVIKEQLTHFSPADEALLGCAGRKLVAE